MKFEYDTNKSILTKLKHKIDFEEAKELFNDKSLVIYPTKYTQDSRDFLYTGKYSRQILYGYNYIQK